MFSNLNYIYFQISRLDLRFEIQMDFQEIKVLGISITVPYYFLISREIISNRWHGRPVASGGAGGACAPPLFGRSVNPISTREGHIHAHQIILAPPGFKIFLRPCVDT